jgi:hypothetical protein
MKSFLVTRIAALTFASTIFSTQVLANTPSRTSKTDSSSADLRQPNSGTSDRSNLNSNLLNSQIQAPKNSSSDLKPTHESDRWNKAYPEYCKPYLFNSEPGSWQFKQDIQRCLYGG